MSALPISTECDVDREFNRTYTSVYEVYTDHTASPILVLSSPGLPDRFGVYTWFGDVDPWAYLITAKASPVTTKDDFGGDGVGRYRIWRVTAVHSTKGDLRQGQQVRDNPVFEPAKIRGSFQNFTEQMFRDRNGKPIVNAAREPYLPPLQKESSNDSFSISFNTLAISLSKRSSFRNSVNSAPIWGLARRRIKLTAWNYEILWVGGFPYVHHDFEFLVSGKTHPNSCQFPSGVTGWYDTLPNMGHSQLVSGVQKPILVNDVRKKEPSYLTCAGAVINPTSVNETWNTFEVEEEADFTTIPGMPLVLPGPFV